MIEPQKWASALGSLSDTVTLPDEDLQFASFKKLFPALTQVPLSEGGVAPQRTDFNTLFKLLGDNIFYIQQGGVFSYSDTADYEKGAIVRYNDNIYKCIQTNGASSTVVAPDSNTAYWQRLDNFVRSVNGVNADTSGNADVISSGNAYIRFADGTQILFQGYEQKAHPTSVQFAKPFTQTPMCFPVILHRGDLAILSATTSALSTTGVSIYAYLNGNPIYNGLVVGFVAFGSWK